MTDRDDTIEATGGGAPTLAVTMGDPGGIGPEIVVQSLLATTTNARFIVHGSGSAMHAAAEVLGVEPFWWSIERGSDLLGSDLLGSALGHRVLLIDSDAEVRAARGIGAGDAIRFERGVHKLNGALSYRWVCDAIDAARLEAGTPGRVDGIVTAPISKSAWHAAGHARIAEVYACGGLSRRRCPPSALGARPPSEHHSTPALGAPWYTRARSTASSRAGRPARRRHLA